jgi:hypothetical protein
MTINLSMLLKADASQAKAELTATGKAADTVSKATDKLGRKGKTAAVGTKALGTSAASAKTQLQQLSVAEVRSAATIGKLGAANKIAAGSVGNLVSQFNDVGVMMAAGQNPLQLALQQGTQITQVIGPMGAAGAVKALGSAFMSMLSPINFITIGAIAAGAAMVGWFRESGPAALSLEERIDSLSEGIDRYRASVRDARMDTASMIERFGSGATEARKYLEALTEVRRREALVGTAQVAQSVTGGYGSYRQYHQMADIGSDFDLYISGTGRKLGRQLVGELVVAYEEIDATANASIEKQIEAWQRTYDVTVKAAEAVDGVSESENKRLALIAEQILRLQELLALDEASKRAADAAVVKQQDMLAELEREIQINEAIAQYGADSAQVANLHLAHEREIYALRVEELEVSKELQATLMAAFDKANPPRNPMAEWAASAYEYAAARVKTNYQEAASARKMLQTLQQENAIRAAILRYGEGSAQVAELRATAEQRVFEATLDTLNVSTELKDKLRAAFEKGQALAGLNMAGGVASAASEAERMAVALGISLETASKIAAMGGQSGAGAGRGGDPRKQGGGITDWQNRDAIVWLENYKPPRIRHGGGGGGATRKEQNAAKDLIKDLKQELAILRETDPVQKEMLRNREALAQATTAEKVTIAELIAQRNNETQTLERQKETWDFLKDTAYGSLDSLILQGNSLSDVMDNLADSIQSAALQAILLGEGPLASLLGTGGSGGLIGMVLGAAFPGLKPASIPANAEGGMIYGPGSGKSDDVLMWGSSGEFMVNAAATKKHRGLLELINSGNDIPGYAAGGLVAPAYMRGQGGGSGGMAPAPLIVIENNSSAAITGETEESVDSSGRRSSRLVLADAVGDAMTTAGGGADRVLKRKYGLRPGAAMR